MKFGETVTGDFGFVTVPTWRVGGFSLAIFSRCKSRGGLMVELVQDTELQSARVEKPGGWDDGSAGRTAEETGHRAWTKTGGSEAT